MNVIELENLSKRFGAVQAMDGLTATITLGRVGLLGPNGAGKSTLVKCLLGLVPPSGGTARVLGLDIRSKPLTVRQRVGYMPETEGHIPGLTAAEFVAYAGELTGMPCRDARKRAHEVLDYVGIGEERYRLVDTYSTGMKQKVKLAQALVHDPDILFLDEPTNGLDPEGRDRMLELVGDLGRTHGIGYLYSSHLLGDVEAVCDEVVIMRGGRVASQGFIEDLRKADSEGFEARIKGDGAAFAALVAARGFEVRETSAGCFRIGRERGEQEAWRAVFESARDASVQLRSFRAMQSTLEDIFLEALETGGRTPENTGGTEGGIASASTG